MSNAANVLNARNAATRIVSFVAVDGGDESTLLGFAANLGIAQADRFHEMTRAGVAASLAGHTVMLGDSIFFASQGLPTDALGEWPDRLRQRGQVVLFIAVDGRTAGLFGVVEDEMTHAPSTDDRFPTTTAGLPDAHPPETFELADGDRFDLRIAPVAKRLGDATVRMLAYNGSIPGPTLRVRQGSELLVDVVNHGDLEATVHWHGLRLNNRYDGTTKTQRPIPVGGRFAYRLTFPDPGMYWYHPHIREDYGQEMGLYGNVLVVPSQQDYWPPVNREINLLLDDVLLENGTIAPFSRTLPSYTAMGRFGNVVLVNGEPDLSLRARQGEVVRFYLTNTANTRVFNVRLPGARLKLVGGDSGRYEREALVESFVIAPSERVVVDALFDRPGRLTLEHRTPKRTYPLAAVAVEVGNAASSPASQFDHLRVDAELAAERQRIADAIAAEPDKTLALVAEMKMGDPHMPADAVAEYVCPMHPDVRRAQPDRCPVCGMKLVPAALVGDVQHGVHQHGEPHIPAVEDVHQPAGIEWEDDMVEVNRMTNPTNMRWKLIDRQTGAEGTAIEWRLRVGDRVKIRLVNEMDSDHPMHHPFHIHGAGRFLILSRDGVVEPNLVWKDTVLVPTGRTVDILLDVTHPGVWMAHCHIAEHHESGMMFTFRVER